MFLLWAVFAVALPPPTIQNCIKAKESQCRDVDFAPGSNLAGEGFDITTMQRKGAYVIDMKPWLKNDQTCTLCKNSFMNGQTQKLPASVEDWRVNKKCTILVPGFVYQSSEALVKGRTSSIENNWQSDLRLVTPKLQGFEILAGSKSKLAEYSMEKSKKDKYSFTSHAVSCGYYSYRVSVPPVLHPDMKKAFESLPQIYDTFTKHQYYKLIDKFGTHYITKVTLGGEVRSVTSIKECLVSLQGLSVEEVRRCLDVEAALTLGTASKLQTEAHHCKQYKITSFSNFFSDRETTVIGGHTQNVDLLFSSNKDPKDYEQWVSSLPTHPEVISYSLEPLHELLPDNKQARGYLRNAISDYILQRALVINCSSPCKIGVKTNPKEPCTCSCHNTPGVALNCCPARKGYAQVTVTVIGATDLYGDFCDQTDAYVSILLNGKYNRGQTPIIESNSPTWNWVLNLGTLDVTQFSTVKLEVWDSDSWSNNDFLGACTVQLKSGVENNFCSLNHGTLYYKVKVTCNPGLSGSSCTEYKPSPMDAQLEKVYVSRNAHRIPRDMLLEMGVLLDERIPRFNQSNGAKTPGFEL